VACPHCLSTDWAFEPSTGRGTVYSYTVVHRPPQPGFDPPYVLAIVDLDEGWSMLTNVVGVEPGDVRIGQRVAVRFEDVTDEVALPCFAPATGEAAPRGAAVARAARREAARAGSTDHGGRDDVTTPRPLSKEEHP
jgi:hypothetical protein